jgi:type VI protein secretion system component Hcp
MAIDVYLQIDGIKGESHKGSTAGHVAGYDGKNWISDFVQNDFWAGPAYRKERPHYAVYRY